MINNNKPLTEEDLFALQEKYFSCTSEQEKKEVSQKLFELLFNYTNSLLLKSIKNFSIRLTPQDVYNRVVDVVLEVFKTFEAGEKIYLSFAGFLNLKILQVLFSSKLKRQEQITSLNKEISLQNNEKEIIESFSFKESAFGTPLETNDPIDEIDFSNEYINTVISILKSMFESDVKFSLRDKLLLCIGIYHTFFNKKFIDIYKNIFFKSDKKLLHAMDIVLKEIYDSLKNSPALFECNKIDTKPEKNQTKPKRLLNFKQ